MGARRSREQARDEILDVAGRLLRGRSVQDLTVGELMERTSVGRSAFYVYFGDLYEVVIALLERVEAQMLDGAQPSLAAAVPDDTDPDLRSSLQRTVAVWAEHGPVLRAIAEAADHDQRVAAAYRGGVLERAITAAAQRIEEGQVLGDIRPLDARETASALVLMNERYLVDRMGRLPQADPEKVVDTLCRIWTLVLYGPSRQPQVRAESVV